MALYIGNGSKQKSNVCYVIDGKEELAKIENAIDESGVLDGTDGTATEKVEQLIEKAQSADLPDWDDDSPIIASGHSQTSANDSSIIENVYWELTEKGTFFWKIKNPSHTGANQTKALLGSSSSLNIIPLNYQAIASKIRQAYVSDGITEFYVLYAPNCERIRMPDSLKTVTSLGTLSSLKELNISKEPFSKIGSSFCNGACCLEKITLNPSLITIPEYAFSGCHSLEEIDLQNITTFGVGCFKGCFSLGGKIVFNANLISLGNNAFLQTKIESVKFQNATDNPPTISSNTFANCRALTDIYCPWAEGAVADAPWGATNATIHYNWTGEETTNETN